MRRANRSVFCYHLITTARKRADGRTNEYTLKLWNRLTRFLDHPIIPSWNSINNATENSMRPVAIGRKNWIHVGSEQAGPRVAAIISIVETCRRLQIPVREYLSAVLPGLENFPANRVNELTPSAWFAQK